MQPHRGTTILVLGILGIVLCPICGIIAWVMGNTDVKLIEQGSMDPAGMESTKAGRICGMIGTIFFTVIVIIYGIIFGIALIGGLASGL